ncbi:Dimeric alpha-beta barrel [Penicillium paradoxum]|uniref:Dimeric alpha-beta barrel n=1 Tax=Penicillium paradoxum TaxID=176176 RepID=UPI002548EDB2|nr:Dimeric alpha-beta barrel [Penicillium paradoxum]KAJ5782485.1 Dimeric alpha-beta barrel [Penicillium paradoxum]
MVYNVMVFAPRKAGITHEQFKNRYEQHMQMIAGICGDAAPVSHTRWYLQHEGDEAVLLAGNPAEMRYDAVVLMSFEDAAGFKRFTAALDTDEAKALVEADEAGFWDRERMKVVIVGDVRESRK